MQIHVRSFECVLANTKLSYFNDLYKSFCHPPNHTIHTIFSPTITPPSLPMVPHHISSPPSHPLLSPNHPPPPRWNIRENSRFQEIIFDLHVGYLLTLATCPLLHPFSVSIQSTKTISPIFKVYRSIGLVQFWPKSSNLISNCMNSARDSSVTKHCHQQMLMLKTIHLLHEYMVSYVIKYSCFNFRIKKPDKTIHIQVIKIW